ncbi:MAG: hypothetical protein EOO44_18450 [Flavobacterium sp.]|nr:MAG: hypothetical protein EOO44_18450 [Flavobacterium sp.]
MTAELLNLVKRLSEPRLQETKVIKWACPVISFGNLSNSKIATLGLNPSNREFVDGNGIELKGDKRRFHTLESLGLKKWADANKNHISIIVELCNEYFFRNPYDSWFKKLDYLISGTSISYYFPSGEACHLDLIPYATSCKWTDLSLEERVLLLQLTGDTLGLILKQSPVKLLILNGQTVVDHLQKISNISLNKTYMPDWTLPRKGTKGVLGYSYVGEINQIAGIVLNQPIVALGYNHNIQSSFGVTSKVQTSIRDWISTKAKEISI